jgi:hypothetical protein
VRQLTLGAGKTRVCFEVIAYSFGPNAGTYSLPVNGDAISLVPEPVSLALLGFGLAGLGHCAVASPTNRLNDSDRIPPSWRGFLSGDRVDLAVTDALARDSSDRERLPFDRLEVHVGLEEPVSVAPGFLGAVHRGVCALDQRFGILPVIRRHADADTYGDT